jgi:hypothetical protein
MEDATATAVERAPTFVLIRILGNDLPPRHPRGETRRNLREILDREPDLPGCERRWVVNRIVDPDEEAVIVALLEERGEPYLLRPLARDGSDLPDWRWDAVVEGEPTYLASVDPAERGGDPRLRRLYDRRVRALIDINGARNAAIDEGRQRATWVLPWDGGCLLTRDAYDELVTTVTRDPELRYLAVPTARIVDLTVLDDPHVRPQADEEHMLAFHRDATERFDPRLTYGVREKVALLRRLGVPGRWDDWRWQPRFGPPGASPEVDRVGIAAWVARLPVGDGAQEVDAGLRWRARATAVLDIVDRYDALVASARRADPSAPLFTDVDLVATGSDASSAVVPTEQHPAERLLRLAVAVRAGSGSSAPRSAHAFLDASLDDDLVRLAGRADEVVAASVGWVPPAVLVDEALRRLTVAGQPHAAADAALRRWAETRASWHDLGRDPRRARTDHLGTWSDVERAVVALRLDDITGALTALRTTQERLLAQLRPDSEPVADDRAAVDALVLAWRAAAAIGRHLGLDLRRADVAGRSIAHAVGASRGSPAPSEGAPRDAPIGARRGALQPPRAAPDAPPRVLFVTDNGHGVGHLTRMLAVARRAQGRFTPVFLTLSEAYPVLRGFGYPAEYLPSAGRLGMKRAAWQLLAGPRLVQVLRRFRPRVVLIDHVGPPDALLEARELTQGMELIWSRRGLWREGRNRHRLALGEAFHLIVEPGDLAAPIDRGATATRRHGVTVVPPITVVGPDELEDRADARAALGLPPDGRAVLIQLSDSDPARLTALIGQAAAIVREVVGTEPVHLFAPQHVLHRHALGPVDGVHLRAVFPLARYLRAFDGVISTAGYNSYHEVVMSGVPAVFVARDSNSLDDQRRRAEFASLCGRAGSAETVGAPAFRDAVARMLRPHEPATAAAVTAEFGRMDGGQVLADLLADRAAAVADRPLVVPAERPHAPGEVAARRALRSGDLLPQLAADGARCLGVVALEHDPDALVRLASEVARAQQRRPTFKPVFLVSSRADPAALDAWGFAFETVMEREEWASLTTGVGFDDYLRGRLADLRRVYGPEVVLTPHPARPIDEWLLP